MNKVLKNHSLFAVTQKEITKVNELPEKKVFQENANIDLTESVRKSVVKRLPWLIILLGLGIGVSATVGIFESLVKQLPAIMFFQSLILDMAGNVGTQSLAVAIRVLMDTELSARKKISLILKECRIGILNGGILGILSFIAVGGYLCLKGNDVFFAFSVSGCLGVAMVVAMAISAFAGTIIPVIFQKVGIDPAVASGPLITTVNDLVAVITYYGLSWIILINFLHF
ncbi:MAG: magnesium transporter [Clostridia bacterium]|nr:magnesium transporter [Clostridia bacterium]